MKKTRAWRKHLTKSEAIALERIDARIKKLDGDLMALRAQRQRIQNRATARAGK